MNMKKHSMVMSFLIVALVSLVAACGGGGGGGSAAPPYSQADLAGTWHISILQTGPAVTAGGTAGWIRGVVHIVSSGSVSAPELYTSATPTTAAPGPDGLVWKINPSTGMISETVGTVVSDFEGKLASGKKLLVGVASGDNNAIQFRVLQKIDSAATYTISDIASKSFMIHQIESGASGDWMHATGFTDPVVSEQTTTMWLTLVTKPSGSAAGLASQGLLSIDASGFVSSDNNPSFKGLLSPDKTYMIGTETDPNTGDIYRLTVAHIIDPLTSYSLADLAGTWRAFSILTEGFWIAGTPTIDAAGHLTMTDQHDNLGNNHGLITADLTMTEPGVYSDPTNTTSHSFLSSTKDFMVMTQTLDFNPIGGVQSSLSIVVK
jgi:hypothetical protein